MECGGDGAHIRLPFPFWDSSVADLRTGIPGPMVVLVSLPCSWSLLFITV